MTKPTDSATTAPDRPALTNEVTAEMIEVGIDQLIRLVELDPADDAEEIVTRIFGSMRRVQEIAAANCP